MGSTFAIVGGIIGACAKKTLITIPLNGNYARYKENKLELQPFLLCP